MDEDAIGILIAVAVVAAVIVALFLLVIPEPSETAVIPSDRLDVAVLSFGNSSAWSGAGETLRTRVETRLVNTDGVSVFSRIRLDALLTEQALSQAGVLDSATAAKIGSLTGVNKLIVGSVYGVDARSEAVTICESWRDGNCVQSSPGTLYSVKVLSQIEVLNAETGQIEQAHDEAGAATVTIRRGETFAGYESLIASAADDIAAQVGSFLTLTYTREIRFGLYRAYHVKGDWFVGDGETQRFSHSDGKAYVIVHFVRVRDDDSFDLSFADSAGNVVSSTQDVVRSGDWRLFSLDLGPLTTGRFTATGHLEARDVFKMPFVLSP